MITDTPSLLTSMAFVFADACRYLADVKRFVLERMTPLRTLKGRNAAAKSDLSVDTLRVRLVPSPTASLTEEDTTLELGPGSAAGFPPGLKKDRNLTDVFSVSYEQISHMHQDAQAVGNIPASASLWLPS